jgi:hypothetical protein
LNDGFDISLGLAQDPRIRKRRKTQLVFRFENMASFNSRYIAKTLTIDYHESVLPGTDFSGDVCLKLDRQTSKV